ncbi:FMN-binding protein [Peptostreptococcus anaerobius]|uniref:FMN-binding protein n=1 Tax=Peptostreptococcus anaerobius TaxID=1261 RepID=UPI00232F58AD|nr:FMN-binding protein [Peptostreptococcus anaerobius]MDU3827882.1 FMN-binding protein [Peptostreptococcus sp.]MDB8820983.1 FMN-binding protein [Peptostreptococcus anaerobius]MDB8826258.1 FMN-binding protein [Peptostreptococcus anaerobius]MDB8827302.1 FMN-binding protein [Peptostreptococcus anaerobius]MDB8829132.1 FMN-binding protein [Peptostreptococcus anaerobius]
MEKKNMIITAAISFLLVVAIVMGTSISKNKVARKDSSPSNRVQSEDNKGDTSNSPANDDSSGSDVEPGKKPSSNNDSSSNSNSSSSKYKDGEYTGSAPGYHGDVKVSVRVEGGQIKDILIVENSDDAEYFEKARSLISDIVSKQSTDVSVVSGATYSSNGIIGAVNNALASGGN